MAGAKTLPDECRYVNLSEAGSRDKKAVVNAASSCFARRRLGEGFLLMEGSRMKL